MDCACGSEWDENGVCKNQCKTKISSNIVSMTTEPDMTALEAIQLIAEFMGIESFNSEGVPLADMGTYWIEVNYQSLDNLISVWEKMNDVRFGDKVDNKNMLPMLASALMNIAHALIYMHGYSFKEAVMIATAKGIKRNLK